MMIHKIQVFFFFCSTTLLIFPIKGGRIGPSLGNNPDLRNMQIIFQKVEVGDLIMVCSDGIHDNFDPQFIGLTPHDVDQSLPEETTWKSLKQEVFIKMKNNFICEKMKNFLSSSNNLEEISGKIIEQCFETTKNSRKWLNENKTGILPSIYTEYPGKYYSF